MAWFIGQSAVMILLAFLLGLLVGWIIWGRRLRALAIEVRALRAARADCEANHGTREATPAPLATDAPPAPMHIPAPRAEVADVANLDTTVHAAAPLDEETDPDDVFDETLAAEATDDFVRIEGIGPKIAAALIAADIRTYRQLANARSAALTSAINNAGITFAPSLATWSQQARLLADGDEAGFLALTDRLIAGRDATSAQNGAGPVVEREPEVLPDPDDLARIEGIGPKIAAALVAAGIRTFGQLADADADTLRNAIKTAGITFAPSLATWSEQARLLADGHEEEFAVLTARLIAGRRADDDLERIEGIGPKMAAALHGAGIRTYRALADSSDTKLRNAISGSGLKFAPSIVTWSRQARLLADGDEEGFADLTRRLVAGRDEGRA